MTSVSVLEIDETALGLDTLSFPSSPSSERKEAAPSGLAELAVAPADSGPPGPMPGASLNAYSYEDIDVLVEVSAEVDDELVDVLCDDEATVVLELCVGKAAKETESPYAGGGGSYAGRLRLRGVN